MTQNQTYSVTVSTSLEVVNIRFLEEFNVSVTVSGLPGGASWQLNIYKSAGNSTQYYTAHSQSATSKNRWDLLGNGTYVLEISQSTYLGALIQLYRSSIAVNGHDMSINLSYHRFNVTEKGLIPGSMWGVVPPGGASYPGVYSFSTFNRSMIIYSANSTDRIDLQSEGYYTPPATFNYTSHASPFVLDFQRCYNITFVEHGIPAVGSNYWSVGGFPTAFDSAVWIGSPGNFSFEVPNGTFNYSTLNGTHQWVIGSYIYDLNFTPSGSNLNFTVNGRDSSVNVYFNYTVVRNLSVPPPAPPSLKLIITVVLVGISTAFMAAAVFYRIRRR